MRASIQVFRSSIAFVAAAALVLGLLLIGGAASTPATGAPIASATVELAAASVKGRQVRIKVKGQRYGKKAKVTLKGYRGKARGVKKTVRVKKAKTVKRLKPGKYKVTAKRITWNGAVAKAKKIKPKRIAITKKRGATTRITYQQIKEPTPIPKPTPTPFVESPRMLGLSSDGARALVSRDLPNGDEMNERLSVIVVPSGRELWSVVTTESEGYPPLHHSDLSPDGEKVAFWSETRMLPGDSTSPESDLYVKDLDTGVLRRVDTGPWGTSGYGDRSGYTSFSPDSELLTFKANSHNYYSFRLSDGQLRYIGGGDACGARVAFAPDMSSWLAQGSYTGMDLYDSKTQQIVRRLDLSWANWPELQGYTADGQWALIRDDLFGRESWVRVNLTTGAHSTLIKKAYPGSVALGRSHLAQLLPAKRDKNARLKLADATTGIVRTLDLSGSEKVIISLMGSRYGLTLTNDGRFLILVAESYDPVRGTLDDMQLVAVDTLSGRARVLDHDVAEGRVLVAPQNTVVYYKAGQLKTVRL